MALRIRRGTSAQRTGITPVSGELIFDTTQNKLYVGNGSTAGGVEVVAGSIGGNLGSNINLNNFDITGTGNINITGTITASGTITGNGDLVLGNADTDNVQFGADINSNIVPNTGTLTVGTSAKPWQTVFTSALENTSGITSNSSLTLNGLVTVGNNLVPSTTRTNDLGSTALRWRTVNAETLSLENIQITQNNIRAVDSNSNINLTPSGTGKLITSTTQVTGYVDVISTIDSITTTRIEGNQVLYGYNQQTGLNVSGHTSREVTYTQVAGSTQETFTVSSFSVANLGSLIFYFFVSNSQGAETFSVTGNVFSGTFQVSSKQNTHVHSSGVNLIDSVSVTSGGGSTINVRLTTTNQINAGVVTTVKLLSTAFRV